MLTDAAAVEDRAEWARAREVQRRFTAPAGGGGIDYCAVCRQAGALGGDWFDVARLAGTRVAVSVGDASGKGTAAALMMAHAQSSVRTAALFARDGAADMLRAVNRHVYETTPADRYATFFYGVLEADGRTMRYVNAGHVPPVVLRRDGSLDWLETGGAPLGAFADWEFEEGATRLEAGDVMVAYTDGVTEAENPAGETWGVEGLLRAAAANRSGVAEEILGGVMGALDEFTGGRLHDDATVLALKCGRR